MTNGAASRTPPERQIEIERESLTGPGHDETGVGRHGAEHRRQHEVGDAANKQERDEHAGRSGDARVDQTGPEFVEVLEEPHLPGAVVDFGFFFRRQLVLRFGHGASGWTDSRPISDANLID